MKNRGFTLIELLAVIVILAIIAIIAVPIILGIVNDSKNQSAVMSAKYYIEAAELAIARKNLDGELNASSCEVVEENDTTNNLQIGDLMCGTTPVKVEIDGEKPESGTIIFSNGKVTTITNLKISNKYFNRSVSNNEMVMSDEAEPTGFTGIIYRHSGEVIKVGDSIIPHDDTVWCFVGAGEGQDECYENTYNSSESMCVQEQAGYSGYTCGEATITTGLTDSYYTEETKSNIVPDNYLKHVVENDIVVESYACLRFTESNIVKEACIKGGDNGEAYGTYDEIDQDFSETATNASGNVAELNKIKDYILANSPSFVSFSSSDSSALSFSAGALAFTNLGYASSSFDPQICLINEDGYSWCKDY